MSESETSAVEEVKFRAKSRSNKSVRKKVEIPDIDDKEDEVEERY